MSRRRWTISLLVVICLAASAAESLHAAKSLDVTKGVDGRNIIPRLAFNPETGDILVVWTQQVPGTSNIKVWVRLFKRKASGKYKRKKAVMLTGAGWNANAHVIWVPWLGRFLVTWDTFDFTLPLASSPIVGQFVKAKGKPKGKVKTLVDDGRADTWPKAFAFIGQDPDDNTAAAADPVQSIILTYTAFPTKPNQKRTGLAFTRLSNKLKQKGITRHLLPPTVTGSAPLSINQILDRPFITKNLYFEEGAPGDPDAGVGEFMFGVQVTSPSHGPLFDADLPGLAHVPLGKCGSGLFRQRYRWLEKRGQTAIKPTSIESDDCGEELVPIPTPTGSRVDCAAFGQTPNTMIVGAFEPQTLEDLLNEAALEGFIHVGDPEANAVSGTYRPQNFGNGIPAQNVDVPPRQRSEPPNEDHWRALAGDDPFAHFIYPKGNWIYKRDLTLDENAETPIRVSKDAVKLFKTGDKIRWLESDSLPEMDVRAIVWGKFESGSDEEVILYVY